MICADEREVDSPPSVGQSRPRAPRRTSGCHGGSLGSASTGTGTTSAPPTENDSLTTDGCVWGGRCQGDWIRGVTGDFTGGSKIFRRRYVTGKGRKASTFQESEFPKWLFH